MEILASYGNHPGDIASETYMLTMRNSLQEGINNRLKEIDEALERLKSNAYGICLICGKKIPEERLRILPEASTCIKCKDNLMTPPRDMN